MYNVFLSVFTLFPSLCPLGHGNSEKQLDFCCRAQTQYYMVLSVITLFPSLCTLEHINSEK